MKMPVRIIIAGSREFNNYTSLNTFMNKFIKELIEKFKDAPVEIGMENIEIVSGGARGADRLGEEWARKHKLPYRVFVPNWKEYGKGAGHVRNAEMAKYASGKSDGKEAFGICVVFWDGKSRGSQSMISYAERNGLMTVVKKIRPVKQENIFKKEI